MTSCPSCQQPVEVLEQHKGTLFTCPHCNAVFFIDWNGQPEVAEHEVVGTDEPGAFENPGQNFAGVPDFSQPDPQQDISPNQFSSEDRVSYGETYSEDYSDSEASPSVEQSIGEDTDQNADQNTDQNANSFGDQTPVFPEQLSSEVLMTEAPLEEAAYDFNAPLDQTTPEVPLIVTPDNSDFSDVTDFGNAEGDLQSLTYSVVIEGLESNQLVYEFKEAITDLRFRWDVNAIMKSIRSGRVVIKGLGPAKASVLVNRLKYMSVKISWRQDVLSGI